MTILSASDLSVDLGGRRVVKGISFSVGRGELVGLLGPNGAGKSTLLHALAGVRRPAAGTVMLDGRALADWPRRARAQRLGFLEQGASAAWPVTVRQVVSLGRMPHRGPWQGESAADRAAVDRAMRACAVEGFADRSVAALSGGERARVMLARVLAGEPSVILADEPAAGLDPLHQLNVMQGFADIARRGTGVVVVLHDVALALGFCARICLMGAGRIAAEGTPAEILAGGALERVYGVEFLAGVNGGRAYALPWRQRTGTMGAMHAG